MSENFGNRSPKSVVIAFWATFFQKTSQNFVNGVFGAEGTFLVQIIVFSLKKEILSQIEHKIAIKIQNIRLWGVFRPQKRQHILGLYFISLIKQIILDIKNILIQKYMDKHTIKEQK